MSENSNKLILLRIFETNSDVTGTIWLDCFLTLRNEAAFYAGKFLAATEDLVGLAKDVGIGASAVTSIGKMEFQRKEAAKAAVLKQKKEILAKKKNLSLVKTIP